MPGRSFSNLSESPLDFRKQCCDGYPKNANCILGIFVEVGVENANLSEIGFSVDVEKVRSKIMQLKYSEDVRLISDGLLYGFRVLVEGCAVISRRPK